MLNKSMRVNYELGVDKYYQQTADAYANPHWSGLQKVLWQCYAALEKEIRAADRAPLRFLDLAAGAGEATKALLSWHAKTWPGNQPSEAGAPMKLRIFASDPYTANRYTAQTTLPCHSFSFADVAHRGALDEMLGKDNDYFDIVVISFALHLVEDRGELWAVLNALSAKARWLVIAAPHKKPDIWAGTGWVRCDPRTCAVADEDRSSGAQMGGEYGDGLEIVIERSRLRLYRSTTHANHQ